ncbi:MAG: hypothetical protein JSS69_09910 [Acidobacteria bacterium]|nr:hypothetical protein [Acidobacteriota bacterium]MBS1866217.1 hypothetical protein [Acidobacteriota bacterium]
MPAFASSWKREPFSSGTPIPFRALWSQDQFIKITQGLIPKTMEDKWFIYYETPHLFFHRSWTGKPVFRVMIVAGVNGYQVAEALAAMKLTSGPNENFVYEAKLLDFLVSNLLLGGCKPFPMPPGAEERTAPGVIQHAVSGTGYPQESQHSSMQKKPWWHFW